VNARKYIFNFFYRAALNAGRSSQEKAVCQTDVSVRLSLCLSNACIVTKRKKDLTRFLYHTKKVTNHFA